MQKLTILDELPTVLQMSYSAWIRRNFRSVTKSSPKSTMDKKTWIWNYHPDWQTPQNKEAVWPFCSIALWGPRQPISGQEIAEWRADLTEILIQIFMRCKTAIMISTVRYHTIFCMLFYHSFAFKNCNESAITKGLRRCIVHDVLSMYIQPMYC